MPSILMVCLANSRKLGGRCIAGINLITGEWVRPVKDGGGELTLNDINYENGLAPKVLDIIIVPVIKHQPIHYQPENWVIDPEYFWNKVSELPVNLLDRYCNNNTVIFAGESDRLSIEQVRSNKDIHSLMLIKIKEICLIKEWSRYRNFPQLRACFEYHGIKYNLAVTDISLEERFLNKKVEFGKYSYVGNFYLTISLGEDYNGFHYKLVTSIINLDRTKSKILEITP